MPRGAVWATARHSPAPPHLCTRRPGRRRCCKGSRRACAARRTAPWRGRKRQSPDRTLRARCSRRRRTGLFLVDWDWFSDGGTVDGCCVIGKLSAFHGKGLMDCARVLVWLNRPKDGCADRTANKAARPCGVTPTRAHAATAGAGAAGLAVRQVGRACPSGGVALARGLALPAAGDARAQVCLQ
jgi:hypothetical protein